MRHNSGGGGSEHAARLEICKAAARINRSCFLPVERREVLLILHPRGRRVRGVGRGDMRIISGSCNISLLGVRKHRIG